MRATILFCVLIATAYIDCRAATRVPSELARIRSVAIETRVRGESPEPDLELIDLVDQAVRNELGKRSLPIAEAADSTLQIYVQLATQEPEFSGAVALALTVQVIQDVDNQGDIPLLLWQENYLCVVKREDLKEELQDMATFSVDHLAYLWTLARTSDR